MKVIQIVTQMEAGGAQKVAHLLHEGLEARLPHPELWFLYTKREAYSGLSGVSSLFNHPPNPLDYAVIAARLYRRLRDNRPDVVITHTHYANVLGQAIAHAAGVPKRIAVHHNPVFTYPNSARLLDRVLGEVGTYSSAVAVSSAVVSTFRSYPARYLRLLTTVRNGLIFPEADPALDVRARYGIPESAPLLVSVGRLAVQKNHELLLRALREVPDAHLAIVGGGELRQILVDAASRLGVSARVHFTGEIAGGAVAAFLKACDAFVFPSLWEGLPMAAIEAMHARVPIVASDIPALREALGDAAILIPPGDVAAFAAGIREVLEDSECARRLRDRAGRRAARFSAGNMIDAYYRLIRGETLAAANSCHS